VATFSTGILATFSTGIDMLTDRRDAKATKRFFRRALRNDNLVSRVVNVDKNPAYPRAVTELKGTEQSAEDAVCANASI
jgi:transposase-like protein